MEGTFWMAMVAKNIGADEVVDEQATTPDLAKMSDSEQKVVQRRHVGHEGR